MIDVLIFYEYFLISGIHIRKWSNKFVSICVFILSCDTIIQIENSVTAPEARK